MKRLFPAILLAAALLTVLLVVPALAPRPAEPPGVRYLGPSPDPYATRFPGLTGLTQEQMDRWAEAQRKQGLGMLP